MKINPLEGAAGDTELIELMDHFPDQRLDEGEGKHLEAMLRDNLASIRDCAGRIRLHADLHSVSRPLRIEIHEDRDLVIEQACGVCTVTTRQSNRVSVAPSGGRIGSITGKRTGVWRWLSVSVMAALMLAVWWIVQTLTSTRLQDSTGPSIAALENFSFETERLKEGEIRNTVVGWETSPGKRLTAVINPGMGLSGACHLPESEPELASPQVLSLSINRDGEAGWVRQRLYNSAAPGAKKLQLPDLYGRTIRVEFTVIRPNPDATAYAVNDVFFHVGIQEELSPGRKAAIHRINTGSKGWPQAHQNLGLKNDRFAKVTVDLKVAAREMRGDAFFVIGIDRKSPPGGQIYVDEISLKFTDH